MPATKHHPRPRAGVMARQAKLFLIRHGETVDNVAQLYAGSRDSALTNHGYQQATRLGHHLKTLGLSFTHIFSSHLQRAAITAGLVRDAQAPPATDNGSATTVPEVVQLPVLMEQDFGFYEGKKFHERPVDSKLSGKEHHRQAHQDEPGFVDVESKQSMGLRVDVFLDEHLLPLLNDLTGESERVIAIVSHGILLSILWKRLLTRLPPKSVALAPELAATARDSLEHLGGWSNTGYLELQMQRDSVESLILLHEASPAPIPAPSAPGPCEASLDGDGDSEPSEGPQDPAPRLSPPLSNDASTVIQSPKVTAKPSQPKLAHGWMTVIQTINGRNHLKGLKRTGGGVGSSRHDVSQKRIDSFFKRRKLE